MTKVRYYFYGKVSGYWEQTWAENFWKEWTNRCGSFMIEIKDGQQEVHFDIEPIIQYHNSEREYLGWILLEDKYLVKEETFKDSLSLPPEEARRSVIKNAINVMYVGAEIGELPHMDHVVLYEEGNLFVLAFDASDFLYPVLGYKFDPQLEQVLLGAMRHLAAGD